MLNCIRRLPRSYCVVRSIRGVQTSRYLSQEPLHELKEEAKPLTNEPIIKQMFRGVFNKEIFVFPEITSNEELDDIQMMSATVEKFMKEDVDSRLIDAEGRIPQETMDGLKQLGLFGQQVPPEYGGLGLNSTKYARLAEYTALDGGIAVTLAAHQAIGLKGILIAGTDEQKAKYLPQLASGEKIAAFCLTEPGSGSDVQSIQSKAVLSEDSTHYILNGNKIWISNGGIADVMTVFAKTPTVGQNGEVADKLTAFIVERGFGGVTSGKPEDKLGIRGSNTCTMAFENTRIPVENVIGEVGKGFKLAMEILNGGRFSMGSSGAGIIKCLMQGAVDYALTRKQFGRPIGEFQLMKEKFANMATTAYAMESMAYLTAGLLDKYEKPDLSLEAAAVKIFSSEGVWEAVSESLQVFGGVGYTKDYPYERYLRDARILLIFEGTNEILRMFIAGNAIQYAGKTLMNDMKRFKDPLNNLGFISNKLKEDYWSKGSEQRLEYQVHPNFKPLMNKMSSLSHEFGISIRELLTIYGRNVIENQIGLARCANVAIDLYAIGACVSRASRSLSIGLRNADHECDLAVAFSKKAFLRIESNLNGISRKRIEKPDLEFMRIADAVYAAGGYCAEHPLSRKESSFHS